MTPAAGTKNIRLLVCGGRDFQNVALAEHALHAVHAKVGIAVLIEGGAKGADRLARTWAFKNDVPIETYPADWDTHGRAAGHIRNAEMLAEGKPHGCIAFPGGRGTADMIQRCEKAGVKVWRVGDHG